MGEKECVLPVWNLKKYWINYKLYHFLHSVWWFLWELWVPVILEIFSVFTLKIFFLVLNCNYQSKIIIISKSI